jgi:hypothetical protein
MSSQLCMRKYYQSLFSFSDRDRRARFRSIDMQSAVAGIAQYCCLGVKSLFQQQTSASKGCNEKKMQARYDESPVGASTYQSSLHEAYNIVSAFCTIGRNTLQCEGLILTRRIRHILQQLSGIELYRTTSSIASAISFSAGHQRNHCILNRTINGT